MRPLEIDTRVGIAILAGTAMLALGLVSALNGNRTAPKGTICDDSAPAVAMSSVGRESADGTAQWFPDDPPLYYVCP